MIEGRFGDVTATVDAIEHAQGHALALLLAIARIEPAHEVGGFRSEAQAQEAVQRKGGVADPGIAVVPIPRPADFFRQAARRGGDERAGRLEGEELERERGPIDDVSPAAEILALRQPLSPILDRLPEELLALLVVGGLATRLVVDELPQHEDHRLALAQ